MDNRLMIAAGNFRLSWFAAFVVIACLAGMAAAVLFRMLMKRDVSAVFKCVTLGVPLGIVFGRINFILFSDISQNGLGACLNVSNGGFGLYGVFLGVFLAALITYRFWGCEGSFGELLDCLAAGGALAVTVGRFATVFTNSEIGYPVQFRLFTVFDSRQNEYNLAVFQLDGIYEALIFLVCVILFLLTRKKNLRGGMIALVMLALHGTNQVVMDSMRSDPFKLGLNRFIKISQIIGITCCISILVYFMIISSRKNRFTRFHLLAIPIIIAAIVLGVMGEYRVGSSNYISNHLMMLLGMLILNWLTLVFGWKSFVPVRTENVSPTVSFSPEVARAVPKPIRAYAGREPYRADNTAGHNAGGRNFNRHQKNTDAGSNIDYESLVHELDDLNL